MVSSTRSSRWLVLAFVTTALGCTTGVGEGAVTGSVSAPSCGFDPADPYDLRPTFFVADAFRDSLDIRVQNDGDVVDYSDGLYLTVLDASEIQRSLLGTPIEVGDQVDSPVRISFSLNESCDFHDRMTTPVSFQAVSGTIIFSAIYAPRVSDEKLIEATFDGVHFVDPADPATRYADLSGSFRFLYTRGRPAQEFP